MGISMILDNFLYLGAAKDTKDENLMKKLGITHILSCAGTVCSPEKYTIANERFEDNEEVDIGQQIENAYWFIEKARHKKGSRVFVHCLAGKSRSASIVLSYLLKRGYNSNSLSDCLLFLHSKRLEIRPNDGFMNQLIELEEKLKPGVNTSLSKVFKEWRSLQNTALKTKTPFIITNYTLISKISTDEYQSKMKSISFLFLEKNLPIDLVNKLYSEQCKIQSTPSIEIQYFTKIVQQELSISTLKAQEFIFNNYFVEWQDIVNYLQIYLESILNK